MIVKSLTYSTLRVTAQYENDRAEVTIELAKGDKFLDAVREAKRLCAEALRTPLTKPTDPLAEIERVARHAAARGYPTRRGALDRIIELAAERNEREP